MRAALLVFVVACGGSSADPTDTTTPIDAKTSKPVDAQVSHADPCNDPSATGNDKGVGRYCTAGGGECNQNSNLGGFIFCTKDYEPDETVQYCTGPCSKDSDCGTNAACTGSGSGGRGCEPNACGGAVDAGI